MRGMRAGLGGIINKARKSSSYRRRMNHRRLDRRGLLWRYKGNVKAALAGEIFWEAKKEEIYLRKR